MNEIKREPAWKEAIEKIRKRFEDGGYGILITDEEFDAYLSIKKPEGSFTYEQFKSYETERLQRYKALEVLLDEHNICLVRSNAIPGFELLPPKEQVKRGYERRMVKVRRELNKAQKAIMNVDHTLLSLEEEAERQRKIMRTAFIKCAINKRKFEIVAPKEQKQISDASNLS